MAAKPELNVVFGAMPFWDKESESARTHSLKDIGTILDVFQKHGHRKASPNFWLMFYKSDHIPWVDTARVYTNGTSERLLGDIGWQKRGLVVQTKLYPQDQARHTPEELRKTLQASLSALRTDKVDLFYLHAPDRTTPWEVTFKAVDDLHKEGKFDKTAGDLKSHVVGEIVTLCRIRGWIQPTVYQEFTTAFIVPWSPSFSQLFASSEYPSMYNPLSGGFLTGCYVDASSHVEPGARFDDSTGKSQAVNYRKRYWNDHNSKGLSIIPEAAARENLTVAEVALMGFTSQSLEKFNDAVIIGASKVAHLEQDLVDLEKPELPGSILLVVDEAWRTVAPYVQKYWH